MLKGGKCLKLDSSLPEQPRMRGAAASEESENGKQLFVQRYLSGVRFEYGAHRDRAATVSNR